MEGQKWNNTQYGVTVYGDGLSPMLIDVFNKIMTDDNIFTVGRLDVVDFEIAEQYFNNPTCFDNIEIYNWELFRARNFPGYFDFEDKKENFILFVKKLVTYFKDIDCAQFVGKTLYDHIINGENCPEGRIKFLNFILQNKTLINGMFIGYAIGFLKSFKTWGDGKKILIISPFSKSLQFQYPHLNNLIKDYTFPKFELITCETNLTWQDPKDTKESLGITTNNWHEECDRLSEEVSKLDFDIAFLSCGSYALHLGHFIKNSLHKKSVCVGGMINILFGIYGKKHDIEHWKNFYNPGYVIDAFENEKLQRITAGRYWKDESVNAYFGYQKESQYFKEII